MSSKRNIRLQKATAGFLLLLELLIQGVCLLHIHEERAGFGPPVNKNLEQNPSQAFTSACECCQFILNKEAVVAGICFGIRPLLVFSVFSGGLNAFFISPSRSYCCYRGPPVSYSAEEAKAIMTTIWNM